jgi:diguanylate cyclase
MQEFGVLRDDLQEAMDRQLQQIQEINEAIDLVDFRANLDETRRRAAVETNKLVDANHQVRDILDAAMVGIARREQWLSSASPSECTDAMTGLYNRTGFEAKLAEWWSKDPHRVRQLSVAAIDIDHFGKTNERHGQIVGDQILRAIAQLLATENRGGTTVARYRGQEFAALFPDCDVRRAATAVEKIRQIVETTCFQTRSQQVQVTLSCGVTEATANDTSETLFSRLEATVQEAKRYGRNRTFVHDGKYPTPVVPPNFILQQRTVVL